MIIEYRVLELMDLVLSPKVVDQVNGLLWQLSSHAKPMTIEDLSRVMSRGACIVIAHDTESYGQTALLVPRIVGMASYTFVERISGSRGEVDDVVVLDEYRGHGIARTLMGEVHKVARSYGPQRLFLTSHPKREAANKLYQSLGYELYETNKYRLTLTA